MRWLSVLLLVVGWTAPADVSASEGATYGIEEFRAHLAASERAVEAWPACEEKAGPKMDKTPECIYFKKLLEKATHYNFLLRSIDENKIKERLYETGLTNEEDWKHFGKLSLRLFSASVLYLVLKAGQPVPKELSAFTRGDQKVVLD